MISAPSGMNDTESDEALQPFLHIAVGTAIMTAKGWSLEQGEASKHSGTAEGPTRHIHCTDICGKTPQATTYMCHKHDDCNRRPTRWIATCGFEAALHFHCIAKNSMLSDLH